VDAEGKELSGVKIDNAEDKSLEQIMEELASKAKAVREDKDPQFKKSKDLFSKIPVLLVSPLLKFISFIIYGLNLDLSFLGFPRDPGGTAMITSVGMLNVDEAFAPLVPFSRTPVILVIGTIRDKPVVIQSKIEIAPIFQICVTIDHRFVDGVYASRFLKYFRWLLETPEGVKELGLN
jgi:pyruvate dehydrogenase E2 component (dihydrolipoamide acetyltransferase)